MLDLNFLCTGIWKQFCHIWHQHPPICLIAKFCGKTKMSNFKTKNSLHGYLSPKMPYFGISGQEFKKNYCQTWNQHLEIGQFPKFHEKTTRPKFRTKNAWFMYFCAGIWKQYCDIWNQHLRICLITNFSKNIKMPHCRTKNALFGYFWETILENHFHIWNQHLRICLIAKFCQKTEMRKFWYKNALIEYFWRKMLSLARI